MSIAKTVLVACGSSVATATVIAMKLKELCKAHNINVNVIQTNFRELNSKIAIHNPDLILVSGAGAGNLNIDIPVFTGLPYLTGVGAAGLDKQVLEILKG